MFGNRKNITDGFTSRVCGRIDQDMPSHCKP